MDRGLSIQMLEKDRKSWADLTSQVTLHMTASSGNDARPNQQTLSAAYLILFFYAEKIKSKYNPIYQHARLLNEIINCCRSSNQYINKQNERIRLFTYDMQIPVQVAQSEDSLLYQILDFFYLNFVMFSFNQL
jgi:hypothetical protein